MDQHGELLGSFYYTLRIVLSRMHISRHLPRPVIATRSYTTSFLNRTASSTLSDTLRQRLNWRGSVRRDPCARVASVQCSLATDNTPAIPLLGSTPEVDHQRYSPTEWSWRRSTSIVTSARHGRGPRLSKRHGGVGRPRSAPRLVLLLYLLSIHLRVQTSLHGYHLKNVVSLVRCRSFRQPTRLQMV
jgi:hypothetical protein